MQEFGLSVLVQGTARVYLKSYNGAPCNNLCKIFEADGQRLFNEQSDTPGPPSLALAVCDGKEMYSNMGKIHGLGQYNWLTVSTKGSWAI